MFRIQAHFVSGIKILFSPYVSRTTAVRTTCFQSDVTTCCTNRIWPPEDEHNQCSKRVEEYNKHIKIKNLRIKFLKMIIIMKPLSLIVVMSTFLPNLITIGWKVECREKLIKPLTSKVWLSLRRMSRSTQYQWTCLPNFIQVGPKTLYAPLSKAGLPPQRFPLTACLMNGIPK